MTKRSLTSPEGRRWIPWFQRIFEEGIDLPPERPAALVVTLASGKYGALSGLYLTPFDNLDAILSARPQVESDRVHALQIRTHQSTAVSAAIAAILDATGRAKT